MKISKIQIKNFKSFQDVTVDLDPDFNVFTGINNSGKTNLLEAIALWHECFNKLIRQAGRTHKKIYNKGDHIFAKTPENYFAYDAIKTVRSSNIEDIFYRCDTSQNVELLLKLTKSLALSDLRRESNSEEKEAVPNSAIEIGFKIKKSHGSTYTIELINDSDQFNYQFFQKFFEHFPEPISSSFASPVPAIKTEERFITAPQIIESIQKRESVEVIRNRLYRLYRSTSQNSGLYFDFMSDLSYILFNGNQTIELFLESDDQKDIKVIVNYKINPSDIAKDIALLGSGTLQIIVILLNLYAPEKTRDLNLILFDEPDSHIHRDIQKRLIDTILKFSSNTQIFLTTHNETLIRQIPLHQLFHIENKPNCHYTSVATNEQALVVSSRFKGIYPSGLNPIISSLGNSNGLDFINAIEADRILFVEGQDDARAIYSLLQKATLGVNTKKYVFWVLGGVSRIFEDLPSYKTVFQAIKNQQTLWDKSVLIFDRDFLNDEHRHNILDKLDSQLNLPSFMTNSYTFESTLLTDLEKLSLLIDKWFSNKIKPRLSLTKSSSFYKLLQKSYLSYMTEKLGKMIDDDTKIDSVVHQYVAVRQKLQQDVFFGKKDRSIREDDVALNTAYRAYLKQIIENQEFYKMANKDDVGCIINAVVSSQNIEFDIEQDFIALLECVDRSTWFDEWNFLTRL
jgi:predicted ATPase